MSIAYCRHCRITFDDGRNNGWMGFCPTCRHACPIVPRHPAKPAKAYRNVAPEGTPSGVAALINAADHHAKIQHRREQAEMDAWLDQKATA